MFYPKNYFQSCSNLFVFKFSPWRKVMCPGEKWRKMLRKVSVSFYPPPPPPVGWSDFLRFSKTGTLLPIRYIFMSQIPKNWRIWPRARQCFQLKFFKKISFNFQLLVNPEKKFPAGADLKKFQIFLLLLLPLLG